MTPRARLVQLEDETHTAVRVLAARLGVSNSSVVEAAIEVALGDVDTAAKVAERASEIAAQRRSRKPGV